MNHGDIEAEHAPLLLAQCRMALVLLAKEGVFVCKMFEGFTHETLRIVGAMSTRFVATSVVKPVSSRATNSERYLVFRGFDGDTHEAPFDQFPCAAWTNETREVFVELAKDQIRALERAMAMPSSRKRTARNSHEVA